MKASELIKVLQEQIKQNGDLDCRVYNELGGGGGFDSVEKVDIRKETAHYIRANGNQEDVEEIYYTLNLW